MQTEQIGNPWDGIAIGEGQTYDAITQSDAAALRAGLQRRCDLAALVHKSMDRSSAGDLEKLLWFDVCELAHREKWVIPVGQQLLRSLSELAVAELLEPAIFREEAARVAWFGQHVNLTGDKVWKAWERTWRQRYQAIYAIVYTWVDVASSHVAHKQNEP